MSTPVSSDLRPVTVVDGEPWYDFIVTYAYEGSNWDMDICARTREEAEDRLRALGYGKVLGIVQAKYSVYPRTRPLVQAFAQLRCWYNNLWALLVRHLVHNYS